MDYELLDQAIKNIEADPGRHVQSRWIGRKSRATNDTWCGTTGCLAGHIVQLAGWMPLFTRHEEDETSKVTRDGEQKSVMSAALAALGLDAENLTNSIHTKTVRAMFEPYNSLDDIKGLRNSLAAVNGLPPLP